MERKPESHDLSAKNKHRGARRFAGKHDLDTTDTSRNRQRTVTCILLGMLIEILVQKMALNLFYVCHYG